MNKADKKGFASDVKENLSGAKDLVSDAKGLVSDAKDNFSDEQDNMIPRETNSELKVLTSPLWAKIDGNLTAETMPMLNADEITLLAYQILRSELMEGGFVQLIQNGYGPFIFLNPFARAIREWGERLLPNEACIGDVSLKEFSKWLYKARKLYDQTRGFLETPTEDEDSFMALYEQAEEWDEFDDAFIDFEPSVTTLVIRAYKQSK